MKTIHLIGVMSGSSLDGIDYALVRFDLEDQKLRSWNLLHTASKALPLPLRDILQGLSRADVLQLSHAETELGKLIGEHCAQIIQHTGIVPDAIAAHGHTILHHPEHGFTLQIAGPSWIAKSAGCPVITDFRSNDIAAGGQGAPLAPVVEKHLFTGHTFYLNLGGIANLSSFSDTKIRAWDIAPCNQLLNFLAQQTGKEYDARGEMARSGVIDPSLLEWLMQPVGLPLMQPYSIDNTWLQQTYIPVLESVYLKVQDKLATVTECIAQSVSKQIRGLIEPRHELTLFVSGGGAHNTFLLERIRACIDPIQLIVPDQQIIDFKEAILMALCGLLRLTGQPNSIASVTGASHDTVNGAITL